MRGRRRHRRRHRRREAKPDFSADRALARLLLNACQSRPPLNCDALLALSACSKIMHDVSKDDETDAIPLLTGSAAEFNIEPLLSCFGDYDIMYHRCNQLAIPAGTAPPTQLPDEFDSRVEVCDIVDSEFPGYVYLMTSWLLTECADGEYEAFKCEREYLEYDDLEGYDSFHGPAMVTGWINAPYCLLRLSGSRISIDQVYCMRCLLWPTTQAADWPTRQKNYGWPDTATIDHVVNNGCDLVRIPHPQCIRNQWHIQYRLSFSRAEVVLLNSWIPVQQIVYHMLRVFVKTERLTENANNSDAATLSNYHIKTLMLWACELMPRSWWMHDLNLVRLCVELLHTLGDLLTVDIILSTTVIYLLVMVTGVLL